MERQIFLSCGTRTSAVFVNSEATFADLMSSHALVDILGRSNHSVWFQHAGRCYDSLQKLSDGGLKHGSTVHVHLRLRGGGGDGGATGAESRASYLEMYLEKKPDKVDPAEEKLARATNCKLSGQRLQPPCVVDELGSLYNKEAVVRALVSKSIPKALGHISSLKHLKDVQLCEIISSSERQNGAVNFQCPVTGLPLNGQYKFCVVFPKGVVVSEKAVNQVPSAVQELVGGPWADICPLNGTQEELEKLWDKLIAQRTIGKKIKKEKRRVEQPSDATNGSLVPSGGHQSPDEPSSSPDDSTTASGKKPKMGKKRPLQDFTVTDPTVLKKIKAVDLAPVSADKKVWASLFTSTHRPMKETYSCRSTSGRGWM